MYVHRKIAALVLLVALAAAAPAQQPLTPVAYEVNKKVVKLYGAGGFKGLPSYGTGILVSPKGHIVTINNHICNTQDIRVHLYDGRLYHAKVISREPGLDVAVLRIEEEVDFLPHYDFAKAAAGPRAEAGDFILGFSNCFQIATRDEPMTVQRGVISALTELRGRIGMFDAPFGGEVYFLDTVMCNPGSAGGALTNRKGDLLGIIGREYKNKLSDTWINYAIPVQSTVEIQRKEKAVKVSMAEYVDLSIKGKYEPSDIDRDKGKKDKGGYHGIVFVVNAVPTTPPFVEEVVAGSPAAKAKLQPDDLVVYVEGELVTSIKGFREMMRHYGPDATVKMEVQRGNRLVSVELKLTQQPKVKTTK